MIKKFHAKVSQPILLMRHGKTDYNFRFEDRGLVEVHGQLSEIGRAQILTTIRELHKIIDQPVIRVITSPKRRCYQTADLVISDFESRCKVITEVNEGFRDVDILTRSKHRPSGSYADWESGLSEGETWLNGWHRCDRFFPGEESPSMVFERVKITYDSLEINSPTMIVCHEEVMLALAELLELEVQRPRYAEAWVITSS